MSLYLYLNEHWHAEAWVNGGVIPINPASTYKKEERKGIYTPDENLIHDSPIDLLAPNEFFRIEPGVNIKSLTMTGNIVKGMRMPEVVGAALYEEDGLILSFSYRLTRVVARKMNKKACIRIIDIDRLRKHIDEKLGVASKAGPCEYTAGHQRNHFLKHEDDQWQDEFRLFWPMTERVEVEIPPGIGEVTCLW